MPDHCRPRFGYGDKVAAGDVGAPAEATQNAYKEGLPRNADILHQKLRAASYSWRGRDYHKLFKHYDRNNSGLLDAAEFTSALRRDGKLRHSEMTDSELHDIFRLVDLNHNGTISADEFNAWLENVLK